MTGPTYDPDISLTDNLAANGYGHREREIYNHRQVYDLATGHVVGDMDCVACESWLKERVRAAEERETAA
jgi:hypothetical protein